MRPRTLAAVLDAMRTVAAPGTWLRSGQIVRAVGTGPAGARRIGHALVRLSTLGAIERNAAVRQGARWRVVSAEAVVHG